jgi:hypothetical protein
MAAVQRLIGVVQDDGSILIKDAQGFQPGMTVEFMVSEFAIPHSITVEEGKRKFAEEADRDITPAEQAAIRNADAMFDALVIPLTHFKSDGD